MKLNSKLFISALLFLITHFTFAQNVKSVRGNVTDAGGIALPGVSVIIKGTGTGAVTDFDGNYQINAEETSILLFDYLGYETKEVPAVGQQIINVSLVEDAESLNEVVVTALGISKEKRALGYASQEVEGEVLSESRGGNVLNALSGNVAGVQISTPSGNLGGSTRILLRGAGSITQNNKPLIVVDGVPLNNDNNNDRRGGSTTQTGNGGRDYGDNGFDVNPDDIESVNVLKGGPAAALYGSRANNGVILITTKSAKSGSESIVINSGVTFESVNIAPKVQRLYGGGAGNPGTIGQADFNTAIINGTEYDLVDYATDESWGPKYDSSRNVLHWDAFDPEFPNDFLNARPWEYPNTDVADFYDTGLTYNNNIAIAKSYENAKVRFSLGNTKSTGIIPNSELDKTTFNFNGSATLNKRLTASAGINYTKTEGFNRPETGYGDNSLVQKFYIFGQTSLDYDRLASYLLPTGEQRTWNRVAFDDATPRFSDNPYWTINNNTSTDRRDRIYGNFKLKYHITNKLYATGNIYSDFYDLKITEQVAVGSQAQSSYVEINKGYRENNYEARLHFDTDFLDEDLTFSTFVGVNRRSVLETEIDANTQGGLAVAGLYTLNNSIDDLQVTELNEEKRVNSVFGSMSLGYKRFLYLDLTGRNDWSSTLPSSNNSYFYPSLSTSLVFSELAEADWLSFGKLRFGLARVGNDTNPYNLENTFENRTTFLGNIRFNQSSTNNNSSLLSEEKTTWEVGLEMAFLQNRLSLDVTYYDETTTDLITPLEVDASTGFTSTFINAGKLSNKGVEALVKFTPVKTDDFEWDVIWNFSKNENKLEELIDGVETLQLASYPFNGVTLNAVVGETYGQIRGTNFVFDDQGNKVIDANGSYLETENVENLGSVLPDYNMGLRNSVSYKNVNLSFLIDMQKGGNYRSLTNMWGNYSGILEETAANNIREEGLILNGVTGTVTYDDNGNYTVTDTTTNETRISAQTYGTDHFFGPDAQNVFSSDYFKLREVTLSYSFPKEMIGGLDGIKFTVFGRNLLTWGLDNEHIDPEVTSTGSGNIQGSEGGSLPSTRSYGFNLQLKF